MDSNQLLTLDRFGETEAKNEMVLKASRKIVDMLGRDQPQMDDVFRLQISHGDVSEIVEVPASVVQLMSDILNQVSKGKALTLVPSTTELTTQEAADILNVSRPYVVKLLEEGKIPHRKVGVRRRLLLGDVMRYKQESESRSERILAELAAQAQELEMGY